MIFTTLSFLRKPYLSGYECDRNINFFPTLSVIINYPKNGGGQQMCNHSESLHKQHWGWKAWGSRDFIWVALAFTEPVIPIQIPFILIRTSDVMTQSNTYGRIIKHLGRLLAADPVVFTRIHWCVHVKILGQGVGIATVPYARETTHSGYRKPYQVIRSQESFYKTFKSYVTWQSQARWVEFS